MSARVLEAWIGTDHVGTLQESNGLWAFQYTPEWLASPRRFALSPHLPLVETPLLDGASIRHVQWYFDNLLPEESQRVLMASDSRVDVADAFGLLASYGAESAGSLTLVPPGQDAQTEGGLRPLSDQELAARINNMPKLPLNHGASKRMSLAGAQHKLAVVMDSDGLFEPVGAHPSTHILKPNHPGADYPYSAVNEWFVMQLAHKMKLHTPDVYRRYVPQSVYITQRFDRERRDGSWRRAHQIDACQLLGLDRGYKYAQGSIDTLRSMALACRSPAPVSLRLFKWLVFNVMVGNADAHLKNLSFLVHHKGIILSPHYDLLSVAVYESRAFNKTSWPKDTQLAWPILGAHRFSEVTKTLLVEAGVKIGIAKGTAARVAEDMIQRMPQVARSVHRELEYCNADLISRRPELAATLAGEARTVRAIVHGVITDMCIQLARDQQMKLNTASRKIPDSVTAPNGLDRDASEGSEAEDDQEIERGMSR